MDKEQLRQYIIRAPFQEVGIWSQSAENLVMGVFGVESNYGEFCVQHGGGPAYGPGQMEADPYQDVWKYCVQVGIAPRLLSASGMTPSNLTPNRTILIYNFRFAALMCRAFFMRFKDPLPDPKDYQGMAELHKTYYNVCGKTDIQQSVKIFQEVCI